MTYGYWLELKHGEFGRCSISVFASPEHLGNDDIFHPPLRITAAKPVITHAIAK